MYILCTFGVMLNKDKISQTHKFYNLTCIFFRITPAYYIFLERSQAQDFRSGSLLELFLDLSPFSHVELVLTSKNDQKSKILIPNISYMFGKVSTSGFWAWGPFGTIFGF